MKKVLFLLVLSLLFAFACSKDDDDNNNNNNVTPTDTNLIWQKEQDIVTSRDIVWSGIDTKGNIVAEGTYQLIVEVQTTAGQTVIDTVELVVDYSK